MNYLKWGGLSLGKIWSVQTDNIGSVAFHGGQSRCLFCVVHLHVQSVSLTWVRFQDTTQSQTKSWPSCFSSDSTWSWTCFCRCSQNCLYMSSVFSLFAVLEKYPINVTWETLKLQYVWTSTLRVPFDWLAHEATYILRAQLVVSPDSWL